MRVYDNFGAFDVGTSGNHGEGQEAASPASRLRGVGAVRVERRGRARRGVPRHRPEPRPPPSPTSCKAWNGRRFSTRPARAAAARRLTSAARSSPGRAWWLHPRLAQTHRLGHVLAARYDDDSTETRARFNGRHMFGAVGVVHSTSRPSSPWSSTTTSSTRSTPRALL